MTRHLHRDYHTAFCGIDASYVLMTYDKAEADCRDCQAAHAQHLIDVAAQQERDRQEAIEREAETQRKAQELREARAARAARLAKERAQLDAEQMREWIAAP